MYTFINGSPKGSKSNTDMFFNKLCSGLNEYELFHLRKNSYDKILSSIIKSDCLVLGFGLYVDSPTNLMLSFMDYIYDNNINLKNKKVYSVINCGFKEGEQNLTAANIIKNWCNKVNAEYCGSLLIGAGEIVGKEKYKFLSHNVNKYLVKFKKVLNSKSSTKDIITTVNYLNNNLYCIVANLFWTKNAKLNGLTKNDVKFR